MKNNLNLLPSGYLRARLIRRRLYFWAPVWLAVVALGIANWWTVRGDSLKAAQARSQCELRYEPVKRLTNRVNALRREIDQLHNRETMLDDLAEPHPPLSGVALIGQAASQCEGRVRVGRLVLERGTAVHSPADRRKTGAADHPTDGRSQITLDGTGLDNQAIATFVESLKATGAFSSVDLKGTIRTGEDANSLRTFVVVCEY